MATQDAAITRDSARASWLYDPRVRGIVYQLLMGIGVIAFVWWVADNTIENLRRQNIASGMGFLGGRAGFDISQSVVAYTNDSTYGRALVVGIINTIIVAAVGILSATIIGFVVGIGRLSRNWLIRKIATAYVEIFRNIPPLLVIFFWYFGVLSVLPDPRQSLDLPFGAFINNRGIVIPKPVWGEGAWLVGAALIMALVMIYFVRHWARARQMASGRQFPVGWTAAGLLAGLPALAYVSSGFPLSFEFPELGRFNLRGGLQVTPEFLALYLALSFYTAAFIAEIVRAGIMGVARGQTEASYALGLRPGPTTRLVVVPQAMRIIIPPLTSQYLNLTKNSSLAIAIGYPDLVAIGGTILNQTGQAIEVVAIWMAVYLGLSLATSAFMNWFNAKMALVER
jgi:general L-amino acid transport system permease protein